MKKVLFSILLMLLPMLASADAVEVDGIYYNLIPKGNAAEVTAVVNLNPDFYYSYSGDVIIPEQFIYDGINYTVTSIGGHAFENCSSLTSITIPNSIKSISEYAFYKCAKLSAVKVHDLAAWCNIDFKGFAASPLQYAHRLYVNDEEIVDLVIPQGVTTINRDAFKGCTSITSVKIPNSVTNIGYESFYDCTSLKSATIGDNNNVASTIIGFRAFSRCSGLESVSIGNNVMQIERNAFEYCTSLASVIIPNSVKSIGSHVFMGCTNLSSVKLPENISKIEWATFGGCSSLESIAIPNTVESIGEGVFSHCTNLTSINLPDNLSSIGAIAFESCSSLTSITIPDKVTTIEQGAFYDCESLTDITLGRGIKTIRCGSFAKCAQLSNVYCCAEKVPTCTIEYFSYYGKAIGAFEDSFIEYITLHVPPSSVSLYQNAATWNSFGTIADDVEVVEVPKCATPTIKYENGKISFSCETDDVEYSYEITDTDVKKGNAATVALTTTYRVTVYATKAGYNDSDVVTMDINIAGAGIEGDVNGDGKVNAEDIVRLANIILGR